MHLLVSVTDISLNSYTNETINQADVALLQWPLFLPLDPTVAYNDLTYYENHTDPNGFFTGDRCCVVVCACVCDCVFVCLCVAQ